LKVSWEAERRFCVDILTRVGVPEAQATVIADSLVLADLRGVNSHGIMRLPTYAQRIRAGSVAANTVMSVVREAPATLLLDANHGSGIVAGEHAMRRAIEKARDVGASVVAVRLSNHCGMLAFFTLMATEHDMIGMAGSNGNALVTPWGAAAPFMGANPLAIAVPSDRELPVVLDMATSMVARGKIVLAAKQGKPIPADWAITRDGHATTDPTEALSGYLLPFGGPKGSGIALLLEFLCGALTGSAVGPEGPAFFTDIAHPQNIGHFFIAIDVSKFLPLKEFQTRVDAISRQVHSLPRARGVDRIYLPGELEFETERQRRKEHIPLLPDVYKDLVVLADEIGTERMAVLN
jgi:LDH2 family malate/lactate/ureidoglycolate dehydrogenase